jgi:hypothetical protein
MSEEIPTTHKVEQRYDVIRGFVSCCILCDEIFVKDGDACKFWVFKAEQQYRSAVKRGILPPDPNRYKHLHPEVIKTLRSA